MSYLFRWATKDDVEDMVKLDRENMGLKKLGERISKTLIGFSVGSRARVVTCGGKIVASYYWTVVSSIKQAVLLSLQVKKEHRGLGLGTELLERFERDARKQGGKSFSLSVFRGTRAVEFYRRNGYEDVGQSLNSLTMMKW